MNRKKISFKHSLASSEVGFTIMEALVATTIVSIIMAMVVGHALSMHRNFYTDIVRTRINGNLRSALDIVSMNVRQAGENLNSSFPAVLLTDGDSGPDMLTLRRNLVQEVLTLCTDASAGSIQIYVSAPGLTNSACVEGNVQPAFEVFDNLRNENGGEMEIYIYDRTTNNGEFFEFSDGGLDADGYFLTTSALGNAYTALNTGIYIVEEFRFSLDTSEKILELYIDGDNTTGRPVAFDVSDVSIEIDMEDDVTVNSLAGNDATYDWKNIRIIYLELTGEEEYRGRTYSSTVTGEFFPRNVLSLD